MDINPQDRNIYRGIVSCTILIWLILCNFESLSKSPNRENDTKYKSYSNLFKALHRTSRTKQTIPNCLHNAVSSPSNVVKENCFQFEYRTLNIQQGTKHYEMHNTKEYYDTLNKNKNINITEDSSYKPFTLQFILAVVLILFISSHEISYNGSLDTKEKTLRENPYGFVFQLWCTPRFKTDVYQFSLKKYMNEIERKSDINNKRMIYEWARLQSFQKFPKQCPVSTLRLAQAGFYSTGKGVEAVCFCCGLKNEYWTEEESVSDLHKRLSPRCKFVNGEETENVPIHGVNEIHEANTEGACGGPNDNLENQSRKHREQNTRRQQLTENKENEMTIYANTRDQNQDNSLENQNADRRSNDYITGQIKYFPGILDDLPKHPEYATRSERLSSFSTWSPSNVMTPEALLEAGFFFKGIQDLVRCFFCGGGMKNWEYGDSPWIEHARWFPHCAFLKLCKGQDFVNLCQMSGMTFPAQDNFQLRDLDSRQTVIVEDQQITDLNSIAAKRVFDVGYSQKHIEEAIRHVRQNIGRSKVIQAQQLLEYILDNCHPASDATSQNTLTTQADENNTLNNERVEDSSSEHNSITITTGEHMAGENEKREEGQSLKEENRILKEQIMCKICMDKDANTVFLPCGHLVACVECAHALRKCAVCRKIIQGTVRAYPS